jgi:hypothetical protein
MDIDPAGYFSLGERIADRRQINEVNSILLGKSPRVSVAEDEGLDLRAILENRPEVHGVSKPIELAALLGLELERMMGEH